MKRKTSTFIILLLSIMLISNLALADYSPAGSGDLTRFAVPFIDVSWDASYSDMKALGMVASELRDGTLEFSYPDLTVTRIGNSNFTVYFTFNEDDELTKIGGICYVGMDNNITTLKQVAQYLEKAYKGTFKHHVQYNTKAAKVNYDDLNDTKALMRGVSEGALTYWCDMTIKEIYIQLRVDDISSYAGFGSCGITLKIERLNK